MPAAFHHGVETFDLKRGPVSVRVVKSSVIFLVGTAPAGPVNVPTLILSDTDAAQFGADHAGFSIPSALEDIQRFKAGTIVVVNVLDPATHSTVVASESKTLNAAGVATTTNKAIRPGTLVVKNQAGSITYVLGTDYTADLSTGTITRISSGAITAGATLTLSYSWLNPSLVTASDVVGTVNGSTNVRTGFKLVRELPTRFGFNAKLLLAPGFSSTVSVRDEMLAQAAPPVRAMALIDAPFGTTPANAIAGRGPAGAINFYTSNERAILCYPYIKAFSTTRNLVADKPLSQILAGLIAQVDQAEGYWVSPSNHEMAGVQGVERPLTAALNDPTCETNALNEVGISTVFAAFGTGYRFWGNRSASWPTDTDPRNFIPVRRMADMVAESIDMASIAFIDKPLTKALIEAVLGTVRAFLRGLVSRGALVAFEVYADPALNPPAQLAAGQLVVTYELGPSSPLERLTFQSVVNVNLLAELAA